MISFFPSPYPDELWYSVICRYHVHSGNYCAKHTLRQLYGDNFCAPSLMLCGPIKALLAQLPQGFLSARDVVMQHTFYPYYARFFPTQRKRSTYAYVVNGNPLAVHRMGISQANGNHCSVMRYCPVCYQEDLQLYGEPYWHRSHQLPDMQICTKHRCWLVDTDVIYSSARQQELFPATFTMRLKKQPAKPVPDCLLALDLLLQDIGSLVLLLCYIVQQTTPIVAEEKLADLDKAPAHSVVADKRCRYHLAAIFREKDACLAVVGFVRQ